jgi:hypothetical protein
VKSAPTPEKSLHTQRDNKKNKETTSTGSKNREEQNLKKPEKA